MEIIRVRRPFWTHQIVEYIVGIVLVSAAIQQLQPAVPALLGLLVILNAAVAKGGAGAFRLVGKRLHRQLDLVVIGLLVLGAVQPWFSLDNTSRFLLAAIAFVLFFVWFHTDFTERTTRVGGRDASGRSMSDDLARGAGRLVGDGVKSFKRWKDSSADDSSRSGD